MKYFLAFLLLTHTSQAQDARYETATGTNSITIQDYESAELISVLTTNDAPSAPGLPYYVKVEKDGFAFSAKSSAAYLNQGIGAGNVSSGVGDIVRGPGKFSLRDNGGAQGFTIRITPVSFPPNQTLIVPPGTNQVQISMESSTNLVNWAIATNGVYGNPNEARFFRLKMTNLQP